MAIVVNSDQDWHGVSQPDRSQGSVRELSPLQVAWRRRWMILSMAVVVSAIVYGLMHLVTPVYTAESDIRIDVPQPRVTDGNNTSLPEESPSLELVRTEMAALSSPALARDAAISADLLGLREFELCPPRPISARLQGIVARLRGGAPPPAPGCVVSADHAGRVMLRSVSFNTDRESYVMQIIAHAPRPGLAARMANAYAAAFVEREHQFRNKVALEAEAGLSDDVAAMHSRMVAADEAIDRYRQQNNLIGLGAKDEGAGTGTLAEAQLEQRNQELSTVTAQLAEGRATLDQIQGAMAGGQLGEMESPLASPVVQGLLVRQATLASTLAELRATEGASHPGVQAAAAAMARNQEQIARESAKVAASLRGEVAALEARKEAVAAEVSALESKVAGESSKTVSLDELEREAQTDRTLYENLFLRQKEVDTERRLQPPTAAVAVEAVPPDAPSFPQTRLMVAGAFLATLGIGSGLAFAMHLGAHGFRDARQFEDELGLPVIGIFHKTFLTPPHDVVVAHPLSVEAEAVHALLAQLVGGSRPGGGGRTLVVTSPLPKEGKSSLVVALGRSAVRAGLSTVVLDCDLRRPSVRRLLSGDAGTSLPKPFGAPNADEVAGSVGVDHRSKLRYLSLSDHIDNPHGLLGWSELTTLLEILRARYDVVILDTPPVLAVADVMKLAHVADKVLLLTGWPGTPRSAVVAAVRALRRAHVDLAGVVLSKVDGRRHAESLGTDGFYVRHYRDYHAALPGYG